MLENFFTSNCFYVNYKQIPTVLTLPKARIITFLNYSHEEFTRKTFEVSIKRENTEMAGKYLKVH